MQSYQKQTVFLPNKCENYIQISKCEPPKPYNTASIQTCYELDPNKSLEQQDEGFKSCEFQGKHYPHNERINRYLNF
ncbi:MAG: hypothetical protein KDD22_01560, partial [Bdellovibrionales bacterium]|nr:hypothetical protein [Bdellovibrionales bacterium]